MSACQNQATSQIGFLNFIPKPKDAMPEVAVTFFGTLMKTGCMMSLISTCSPCARNRLRPRVDPLSQLRTPQQSTSPLRHALAQPFDVELDAFKVVVRA
jgi:hypothetical protein